MVFSWQKIFELPGLLANAEDFLITIKCINFSGHLTFNQSKDMVSELQSVYLYPDILSKEDSQDENVYEIPVYMSLVWQFIEFKFS